MRHFSERSGHRSTSGEYARPLARRPLRSPPSSIVIAATPCYRSPRHAPVAQLDRAPGFEPGGRRFESVRARHQFMHPSPESQVDEPRDAAGWHARALAFAAEQRMFEATQAFARAAALAPADVAIAAGYAQACYSSGLPAAQLFMRARQLAPANPDITMHTAVALAAEGSTSAAESLLIATLEAHPDWLDGHRCLAT